jgi:uncharacterized protein YdaT
MKAKKWESQTTKKEEIKTLLTAAFAHLRNAILETDEATLDKAVSPSGRLGSIAWRPSRLGS